MKKIYSLVVAVIIALTLTLFGCAKPADNGYKTEHGGNVAITVEEKESFYYAQINGEIALSELPNSLTLLCNDESISLDVVAVNVSNNGLYVINFRQTHIFKLLEEKEYTIGLTYKVSGKTVTLENFGTFNCNDAYFEIYASKFNGEIIHAMDREKNWTGYY